MSRFQLQVKDFILEICVLFFKTAYHNHNWNYIGLFPVQRSFTFSRNIFLSTGAISLTVSFNTNMVILSDPQGFLGLSLFTHLMAPFRVTCMLGIVWYEDCPLSGIISKSSYVKTEQNVSLKIPL